MGTNNTLQIEYILSSWFFAQFIKIEKVIASELPCRHSILKLDKKSNCRICSVFRVPLISTILLFNDSLLQLTFIVLLILNLGKSDITKLVQFSDCHWFSIFHNWILYLIIFCSNNFNTGCSRNRLPQARFGYSRVPLKKKTWCTRHDT